MAIHQPLDATLHLPRILCLHGGGTNARIFRLQCRILRKHLESSFRLCFAEAPFPSQAGPDVTSVYGEYGPFRRWLRWRPDHPEIEASSVIANLEESLEAAKRNDDAKGATGEWVGLLGFSQGANICASMLLRQQIHTEKPGKHENSSDYRFAVLLAGRGPLIRLEPRLIDTPALVDASQIISSASPAFPDEQFFNRTDHVIRLPTIHVHGLRDPGLERHRLMQRRYCNKASTTLLEWDGDHRVPIKNKDVAAVAAQIFEISRQTGVMQ